ncbi:CDT1-like protein b [Euphorbia lathyris]|uniref:CDT1-like protein b n=1 Tax=Euphorbia lathyris TaxID=212925 RepID=UPI003313CA2E
MDQNEEVRQSVLDSKPEEVLSIAEKSNIVDATPKKCEILTKQTLVTEFTSQTPVKTNQPWKTELERRELELFQRHKNTVEVFDAVCCSLRLLGLRKKPTTFENIHTQVEVLTGRKFSYGHLAQLKYILPEAIQIDKILVHDKETLCMKPDMKITLVFDVVDGHRALHQLFISKLINYFTANPKMSDIPEAMLPDSFNQPKETASSDLPEVLVHEPQASETIASEHLLSNASLDLLTTTESELYMYPSFTRHFSKQVVSEKEKTKLLPHLSSTESYNLGNQDTEDVNIRRSVDISSKFSNETNLDTKCENMKESLGGTDSESTPINPKPTLPVSSQYSINTNACESPLLKHGSSVDCTVLETPAQSTPKRVIPSSDDDNHKGVTSQKQTSSNKPAKRSLNFSFVEGDESESPTLDASSALLQKVEKGIDSAAEEHRTSQTNLVHRLPGLVSLIHRIFQSISYSSITKEELVFKIIINDLDVVDRGEVEEQIEILEKLVPEWIYKKLASSGDTLYSIKKMSDLNCVRSKVACI